MDIVRRLEEAAAYMRGSWKSTHRATGALLAEAAGEIEQLRAIIRRVELCLELDLKREAK